MIEAVEVDQEQQDEGAVDPRIPDLLRRMDADPAFLSLMFEVHCSPILFGKVSETLRGMLEQDETDEKLRLKVTAPLTPGVSRMG